MAAATFGTLPQRPRASHACMKDNRCVGRPQGPLIGETRCGPDAPVEQAHVIAGFLSPNQCDVLEVRKLRAGARVLAERLEAKLHGLGLGGGAPGGARVGSQYLPSPFDGLSVTVITARVAPTDAPAVRQVMQESMCKMLDQGLTAEELARATDSLSQWVTASEREPRYWSMLLARSTMTGLDPDQLIDNAAMYRAHEARRSARGHAPRLHPRQPRGPAGPAGRLMPDILLQQPPNHAARKPKTSATSRALLPSKSARASSANHSDRKMKMSGTSAAPFPL